MFVDVSVIVAIPGREHGHEELEKRLARCLTVMTSPEPISLNGKSPLTLTLSRGGERGLRIKPPADRP